ncbi:MAG TPA: hypothetical protein DCZ91_00715, partial [Lachnospiraceae bacterium]|nr:hypothetical protein [Lachnospiraceae bacterium]
YNTDALARYSFLLANVFDREYKFLIRQPFFLIVPGILENKGIYFFKTPGIPEENGKAGGFGRKPREEAGFGRRFREEAGN